MCVIIVVFRRVVPVFKQTQNENVVFNFFPNHIQMKYIAKPKQEKSVLVFSVIAVGLMDYMNWAELADHLIQTGMCEAGSGTAQSL